VNLKKTKKTKTNTTTTTTKNTNTNTENENQRGGGGEKRRRIGQRIEPERKMARDGCRQDNDACSKKRK
jgi:hypothetical protein